MGQPSQVWLSSISVGPCNFVCCCYFVPMTQLCVCAHTRTCECIYVPPICPNLCASPHVSLPQDATATAPAAAPFLLPPSEQETSAQSAGKAAPSAAEDAAPAPAKAQDAAAAQDEVHIEINEALSLGNGSNGSVCPPCTTPAPGAATRPDAQFSTSTSDAKGNGAAGEEDGASAGAAAAAGTSTCRDDARKPGVHFSHRPATDKSEHGLPASAPSPVKVKQPGPPARLSFSAEEVLPDEDLPWYSDCIEGGVLAQKHARSAYEACTYDVIWRFVVCVRVRVCACACACAFARACVSFAQ